MFSYYGCKNRLAQYYPKPNLDKIIEPFCGAAFYSLYGNNWKNEVILYDKYDVIVDLWKYLIQAKESDILKLPILQYKENIDSYTFLTKEERYLIGFFINSGSAIPKKSRQKFCGWNESKKQEISDNFHKIRHWKVEKKEYLNLNNEKATWFIDPPYQFGGIYYRHNSSKINFTELSKWCQNRIGQIIVCENSKADWIPLNPLKELKGQLHKTMECIYYKEKNE